MQNLFSATGICRWQGKKLSVFLAVLVLLLSVSACAEDVEDEKYSEGIEYDLIKPAQSVDEPDKIEVLEVFSYACPHCNHFEPTVQKWLKSKPDNIVFKRMPTTFGRASWKLLARAYYIAEVLGVVEKVGPAIFSTVHEKKQKIADKDDLMEVFIAQGVSKKDFLATYDSFAVDMGMRTSKVMTEKLGITGVPSLVVQGKYRTSPSKVNGGNAEVFTLVEYLAKMVAKEK